MLAADGRGNVIITWNESPATSGDDYRVIGSGRPSMALEAGESPTTSGDDDRGHGSWRPSMGLKADGVSSDLGGRVAEARSAPGCHGRRRNSARRLDGTETRARVRTRGGTWRQVETIVLRTTPARSVASMRSGIRWCCATGFRGSDGERIRIAVRARGGAWGASFVSEYEKDIVVDDLAMGGNWGAIVGWDMTFRLWTPHVHYREAGA